MGKIAQLHDFKIAQNGLPIPKEPSGRIIYNISKLRYHQNLSKTAYKIKIGHVGKR